MAIDEDAYQQELKARDARQKKHDAIVDAAMTRVLEHIRERTPAVASHMFYGATGIDPQCLVTWYVFQTDAELAEAKEGGLTKLIDQQTRHELTAGRYPPESVPKMMVSFTTDEDIERTSPGNPWDYFK